MTLPSKKLKTYRVEIGCVKNDIEVQKWGSEHVGAEKIAL